MRGFKKLYKLVLKIKNNKKYLEHSLLLVYTKDRKKLKNF